MNNDSWPGSSSQLGPDTVASSLRLVQFSYLVDPLVKPNVVDNMKFRNVVLLMARSRVVDFFQDLNSLNELKTTEHAGIKLG